MRRGEIRWYTFAQPDKRRPRPAIDPRRSDRFAQRDHRRARNPHHPRGSEMLKGLREIEIGYYARVNATYAIEGRTFQAGNQISGIYRRLP
jgi:hypothetical protein